jgi:predicted ATPase
VQGYAAPEVQDAYARALELARTVGETQGLFWIMRGLSAYYFVQADLPRATEVGDELLALANPENVSEVMDAHYTVGLIDTFKGDFVSGRSHLEQSIALDYPERDRSAMFLTGLDVGVIACSIVPMACWALGYPDQALAYANRSVALAEEISHPLSLTCALFNAALAHVFRGEREHTRERAAQTVHLADELGFFFDKLGYILLGWAEEGSPEAGEHGDPLRLMEDSLAQYRSTGSCVSQTCYMALIAEVALRRGDVARARRYLTEALELVEHTQERFWAADLHRLLGETALREGGPDARAEAERSFETALGVARRLRASSLELRAALGLSRLWAEGGRSSEARALLERALAAIPEGHDTADPRAARHLLASLAGAPSAAAH